jgi:ABC-type sugar transport systems, permease components
MGNKLKSLIALSISIMMILSLAACGTDSNTVNTAGVRETKTLAGLQTVSRENYEACTMDGASPWQKFKYITLPLIMPSVNNAVILNLIGGLKVFDIVTATTNGGPGSATQVLNTVIYRSYSYNLQGEACAGNVVLTLIVIFFVLITYTNIRKREVEV